MLLILCLWVSFSIAAPKSNVGIDDVSNLWDKVQSNLDLKLDQIRHPKINAQLATYINYKKYFYKTLNRSNRYLHYIVEQLEKRQMPLELVILPIIESAYDPYAYSKSHASGLWQFIPSTGRYFNLTNDWWFDGRRDIQLSTQAALNYLEKLNKRFHGDWLLTIAAYNGGGGTVSKAIKRNKKKNTSTDFWSLDLPKETQQYVPKFIAVAKLLKSPKQYGIELPLVINKPYFSRIKTQSQISLIKVAELADVDIKEIQLLNPGYNWQITMPSGPHHLLVPIASAKKLTNKLAKLPTQERLSWNSYKIQPNDTLSMVAEQCQCPVDLIKNINGLQHETIHPNQLLKLPVQNTFVTLTASHLSKKKINYQVKNGDSLWKIAKNHNLNAQQIAHWNNLHDVDTLRRGSELIIWRSNDFRE